MARSIRMGFADSLARTGQPAALARAIALEPRNDAWAARRATLLFESGDTSAAVEEQLRHALASRPDDSAVLIALGLLYEQRGNNQAAEALLRQATTVDHRFTPAWTIANFYFRTGEVPKMWPALRACLSLIEPKNLEPWSFDPAPIYELAWQASDDPNLILSQIPKRRETLVPYLAFLTSHPELQAGGQTQHEEVMDGVWPEVFRLAEPADTATLVGFLDQALKYHSAETAVRAWNDLIDRGFISGNRLNPKAGQSIADPDFTWPEFDHGFGWRIPYTPGVIKTLTPHSLSLDFTGAEPEAFTILSTYGPVLPGRKYRLRWKLDKRAVPGFAVAMRDDSIEIQGCGAQDCEFEVPAGLSKLEILVTYRRPAGAVRLRNTVEVKEIRLELEE